MDMSKVRHLLNHYEDHIHYNTFLVHCDTTWTDYYKLAILLKHL